MHVRVFGTFIVEWRCHAESQVCDIKTGSKDYCEPLDFRVIFNMNPWSLGKKEVLQINAGLKYISFKEVRLSNLLLGCIKLSAFQLLLSDKSWKIFKILNTHIMLNARNRGYVWNHKRVDASVYILRTCWYIPYIFLKKYEAFSWKKRLGEAVINCTYTNMTPEVSRYLLPNLYSKAVDSREKCSLAY